MKSPHDGEHLASRVPEMSFNGYLNNPGTVSGFPNAAGKVDIEIWDDVADGWVTFASTASNTSGWTDADGTTWYAWSTNVRVPRAPRFWPSSGGQFRAVDGTGQVLFVGNSARWACVATRLWSGNEGAVKAYQNCPGANPQVAAVTADCDIPAFGGCFDTIDSSVDFDWPKHASPAFAEEIQGITSDDNYWYFSNSANNGGGSWGNLARMPIDGDLNNISSAVQNPFDTYDHPGDMDVVDGWLYVAVENHGGGSAPSNALGAIPTATFTDSSTYLTFPVVGAQAHGGVFPWVSYDPITGYLYSSRFDGADRLIRYDIERDSSGTPTAFTPCGEVLLGTTLNRVQGGDFSESGRLYLSTDPRDQTNIDLGAVFVVEMNGHLMLALTSVDPETRDFTHAT